MSLGLGLGLGLRKPAQPRGMFMIVPVLFLVVPVLHVFKILTTLYLKFH